MLSMKKVLRHVQTLCAGYSKAEPKILPFSQGRDGQN